MFVTKKITKRTKIIVIFAFAAAVLILVRLCACQPSVQTTAVSDIGVYELSAATNEERVTFLAQFGWQVDSEPSEVEDVTVPQVFNKVYNRYNKIQLEQGLDLLDYAGKECSRVTYTITNYPDTQQRVNANLLIYNGVVVGGDISSAEIGGFMHGFALEGFSEEVK